MSTILKSAATVTMTLAALILPPTSAQAEVQSKSKDLVVMEPGDLPEPARMQGNALLIHADNGGSTYLYVEQQNGARIAVFDVTDPSQIKLAVSTPIPNRGTFDFVRPLGDSAELVYFRQDREIGVLDLRKAKSPVLRTLGAQPNLATAEQLGRSGLLVSEAAYKHVPAVARDFQVVDIASANPVSLATVKDVKYRATNNETGTTFFLGSEGLTVVRQLSLEDEHQIRELQMRGN